MLPESEPRPDLLWQLDASLATLRKHNRDVPVALFVYGALNFELSAVCRAHSLMVQQRGRYEQWLAALCPVGWPALARYPLLHKFLNFDALAGVSANQILYCDCDTIFFGDVARIFDRYAGPDLVAREEVHTSRNHNGADPSFVDESLLTALATIEGAAFVPPFNLGVVLLNNRIAARLAPLQGLLVDYAWRFVAWMDQNPATGATAAFGEFKGAGDALAVLDAAEAGRALPFPSVNRWILDEVALWMTLGHLPGLRTADFDPRDVVQNGEFAASDPSTASYLICHYFSQNTARIAAWLRSQPSSIST
jgi:hypothetical protein